MSTIVAQKSHPGRVRPTNEDSCCVLIAPNLAPGLDALLVVADGMGGHQAGDVANSHAVAVLGEAFSAGNASPALFAGTDDSLQAYLRSAVETANEGIFSLASDRPGLRGMGTTITAALLAGNRLIIAQIGDSRAYLIQKQTIQQLTQDHSWLAQQVRAGGLTPEKARHNPNRNVLTRAAGGNPRIDVDLYRYDFVPGDILVLCSDGLFNLVRDDEIHQIATAARNPQRACDTLVDTANQRGGTDNITVVVACFESERAESPRIHGYSSDQSKVVTVLDARDISIQGLEQSNFEVYEDGKPVPVSNVKRVLDASIPLVVALAVDTSGSMRGQALSDAKKAAGDFISTLGPSDLGAVAGFGSKDCKLSLTREPTADKPSLTGDLDKLQADCDTPFFEAAFETLRLLSLAPAGRRVAILLTDGEDTCSILTADDVINRATRDNVPLFTIGLGQDLKPEVLQRLSKVTGGRYMAAATSAQLSELYKEISDQLKSQYVITYRSNVADSQQHSLSVKVKHRGNEATAEARKFIPILPPKVGLPISSGQSIETVFRIEPAITSQAPVSKVEYFIDDVLAFIGTKAPFDYPLDPTNLAAGKHRLTVRAQNNVGGFGEAIVEFSVPGGIPSLTLILGLALLLPVVLVVAFYWRSHAKGILCPTCGRRLEPGWKMCPYCPTTASSALPSPNMPSASSDRMADRPAPPPATASTIRSEPLATQTIILDQKPGAVGWLVVAKGAEIVVDDPAASRRHATIRREGSGFYVRDLSSTNGTLVNGRAIDQHRLEEGDQIQIGENVLIFTLAKHPS